MMQPHSRHLLTDVSPEAIDAGVRVLRESGALVVELSADCLLVRQIVMAVMETEASLSKMSQRKPLAP